MNKQSPSSILPDLLCIGFSCHDLHKGKNILGGTASYSSIMASHLGVKTALLTSVGKDFEFLDVFKKRGIQVCNIPAEKTTVFENIYQDGQRIQYIYNRSTVLFPKDLPANWKNVPIVKFCLIADEVDFSFLQLFPKTLKAATIQGWLRQWDENGKISPKEIDWEILKFMDIVFLSEDDILGYESALPKIVEYVEILVMTKGKNGALVFHQGKEIAFPAFPVKEVDPTGAGDIFASSFLIKYQETNNITQATAFAHAAASFIVEDYGIKIPDVEAIQKRYESYLSKFHFD